MGYLGAEEKTREAFDSDGWHHSGDVGTVDEDGFYTITGRIKGTVTQYPAEAILVIFGRISGCRGFCGDIVIVVAGDPHHGGRGERPALHNRGHGE